MSARTLKIRSEQNGIYSKKYLTRMRFVLPSDLMMTDAGNSYLALQTQLMNADGTVIDTSLNATGAKQFYGFGNGSTAYSPSCMIRTAKLFSQISNKVIEEINFSNLKTANFESLQSDTDVFAASTSFNGSAISEAIIKNIQDNWSQWTEGGSQELHIRLKDLFPSLNTSMFSLKQNPLIIDLEMEVNRDLINILSQSEVIQEPPSIAPNGGGKGFVSQELSPVTSLVQAQVNVKYQNVQTPNLVIQPTTWLYSASEYGAEAIYSVRDAAGDVQPTPNYLLNTVWTDADYPIMGFPDSGLVKAVQTIKNGAGVIQEEFNIIDFQQGHTAGATYQTLEMATPFQAVRNTFEDDRDVTLESLNPYTTNNHFVSTLPALPDSQTRFQSLRDTKSMVISPQELALLQSLGLIDSTSAVVPAVDFEMSIRLSADPALIVVASDSIHIDGGLDYDVSNQSLMVPRRTGGRMSLMAFDVPTGVLTFTQDLELAATATDYALGFYNVNTEGVVVASASITVAIADVKPVGVVTPEKSLIVAGAYPEISKAEIVLKQFVLSPTVKVPQPTLYRTFKCQPFNINAGFNEYVGNFELEPNVYNAYVILPYPTDANDLISYGKNVYEYRATLDDVDLTNVNVDFNPIRPSTLYYDRLIDTFSNSQMELRCLDGRAVGLYAGKTRIIPIKIYQSMLNGQAILSPSMKRLQVRLIAAGQGTIAGGTAYLFKELYMSY